MTQDYRKYLIDRAAALEAREARNRQKKDEVAAEEAAIIEDKRTLQFAIKEYERFSQTPLKGNDSPPSLELSLPSGKRVVAVRVPLKGRSGAPQGGYNVRVGPQRAQILEKTAELTVKEGYATARAVADSLGVKIDRVQNVYWEDRKRGFIARYRDGVKITREGWDFMRVAGLSIPDDSNASDTEDGAEAVH